MTITTDFLGYDTNCTLKAKLVLKKKALWLKLSALFYLFAILMCCMITSNLFVR